MVPVADPVVIKDHGRSSDEIEADVLRELLRINVASIRELISERDNLYRERLGNQEKAVLAAAESQKRYDLTHNDLVRKMESMIPRAEADQRWNAQREMLDSTAAALTERIAALEKASYTGAGKQALADPMFTELVNEMRAIRQIQAGGTGKSEGKTAMWGYVAAGFGFILTFGSIILLVIKFLPKGP